MESPDPPDWPEAVDHLWDAFWDMNRDRATEHGPQPLGVAGIKAWAEATGAVIRPEEVSILREMDTAYREALAKEIADNSARQAESEAKRGR